jgi:gluconolactonase
MTDFDMSTLKIVATGLKFPEGPVAMADGSLIVVEIEGGSAARIAPDGTITRFDCGGGPNGAAVGPDGAIYIGNDGGLQFKDEGEIRFPWTMTDDNPGGSIQRLDLNTGEVKTIFTESGGQRIGGLNDIVFDTSGSAYTVDTARGVLHYFDPIAGNIVVAEEGLEIPNGGGLSPDGKVLYVSETYSGRLFAWDVAGPGKLTNRRQLYSSGGAHGFDGLAIDGAGNICVANLTKSGISVFSPAGEQLGVFRTPKEDAYVTNICFGGPDGNTAYICSSGRGILYSVQWPWPGLRLNFAC